MRVKAQEQETKGATVVYLVSSSAVIGMFILMDAVRPSARKLVAGLRRRGLKEIQIISGDVKASVQEVAKNLGLTKESVWANLSPARKLDHLKKLKDKNVMAIGDANTDRQALAQASLGIGFSGRGNALADPGSQVLIRVDDLTLALEVLKAQQKNRLIWTGLPLAGALLTLLGTVVVLIKF